VDHRCSQADAAGITGRPSGARLATSGRVRKEVVLKGDPDTDSVRRHLERVLKAPASRTVGQAAVAGAAAWGLWRLFRAVKAAAWRRLDLGSRRRAALPDQATSTPSVSVTTAVSARSADATASNSVGLGGRASTSRSRTAPTRDRRAHRSSFAPGASARFSANRAARFPGSAPSSAPAPIWPPTDAANS
jgi:hypothetical protein